MKEYVTLFLIQFAVTVILFEIVGIWIPWLKEIAFWFALGQATCIVVMQMIFKIYF